jgi:hypothetical protein
MLLSSSSGTCLWLCRVLPIALQLLRLWSAGNGSTRHNCIRSDTDCLLCCSVRDLFVCRTLAELPIDSLHS